MKKNYATFILYIYPLIAILISLCVGRYPIYPDEVLKCFLTSITGNDYGLSTEQIFIIMNVRLPRTLVGGIVGAALAASGCAFQGVFRNPLVSQGVLGVSAGASFGAALSILLFSSTIFTPFFAFIFGTIAVILSFMVAKICSRTTTLMLVLGGTIISSIFSSMTSLIKYVADPTNQLSSIVFWNMGSLASISFEDLPLSLLAMAIGVIILIASSWSINVLSMGENEAKSVGLSVKKAKLLIISGSTLATAGAVSLTGSIGWIGLIVPHIARFLLGVIIES